ncbi:MAG: Kdo domain containing protein, partial [Christiangramia sp.]|nr:Kdo domain containing protein [Christiangramia sp.]
FFEETSALAFKRSFYVSQQVDYDLTFRELVDNPDLPQHEEILRAFTRFTYTLHENDILFLDHSPGNTLIQLNNGDYKFYLVDLNRMVFKELTDTERYLNFSRLTPKREMVEVMADEYAKLIGRSSSEVFAKMWFFTDRFQKKYWKKQKIKRLLKPRKN